MPKEKLSKKSLYLFKICSVILVDEIDNNIIESTAYKQKIKSLVKNLYDELEKEYIHTYEILDDENLQKSLFYVANTIEGVAKSLADAKDSDELQHLIDGLRAVTSGNFPFNETRCEELEHNK